MRSRVFAIAGIRPIAIAADTRTGSDRSRSARRSSSADRGAPWTAEELEAVPFDRGFSRYVGQYSVSFITMTVSEDNEGLHLEVPMYGGGSLQHMGGTTFSGSAAGETVKLEFVVEEDGRVSEMILNRNGELIPVKRKD